jgi:hypothetical protein
VRSNVKAVFASWSCGVTGRVSRRCVAQRSAIALPTGCGRTFDPHCQYAGSTQHYCSTLHATNIANAATCIFIEQPTQLDAANVEICSFGTKRSWVRIPPPRLASSQVRGPDQTFLVGAFSVAVRSSFERPEPSLVQRGRHHLQIVWEQLSNASTADA